MARFWSCVIIVGVLGASAAGGTAASPYRSFDDLSATAIIISDRAMESFSRARLIAEEAGARGLQMFPPDAIFGYFPVRPEESLFDGCPVILCFAPAELEGRGLDAVVAHVLAANFNRKEMLRAAAAAAGAVPGADAPFEDLVLRVPEDVVLATTPSGPRRGSPREVSDRGINQNSEFLIGSVALNIIFPESVGGSENWTDEEIADCLAAVSLGLSQYMQKALWVNLSFVYNYKNFRRVPVTMEPITSNMGTDHEWVGEAISRVGYSYGALLGTHLLNNDARDSLKTDWSYTAYIADMSAHYNPDPPSPDPGCWGGAGYVAYSYLGGPYMVIPYPACRYGDGLGFGRVFIHEMSHGFWALDEYANAEVSCSDKSGYLNIPTRNTLFFPCQETVPCIMQTSKPPFAEPQPICEYTMGQVGLADVNENSVPDLYEVAPEIEFMSFPGVQMDTLLPDEQYVLSVKVWNDAVPNANSQQYNPDQRIDYAPAIRSGEISYNGAPFLAIAPTDGTWDEANEILAYDMVDDPLEPGLNTITMRVKNRVDLQAQVDKQVFVIGLKYDYISAASQDSVIRIFWTTAAEVFNAEFEVLRTDITAGEEERVIAVVAVPDEANESGRAYSYLDRGVKAAHRYRYRVRGSFTVNVFDEEAGERVDKHYEFLSGEASETAMIPVGKLVSYLLPNPMTDYTSFTIAIPKTFRDPSGSRAPALSSGIRRAPALVEEKTDVDIGIYNVLGQRIRTIYSNSRYGGVVTRSWDGTDSHGRAVPSGVYFLYAKAGDLQETRKIIVVR